MGSNPTPSALQQGAGVLLRTTGHFGTLAARWLSDQHPIGYHTDSAALIVDGDPVAAIAEVRLNRLNTTPGHAVTPAPAPEAIAPDTLLAVQCRLVATAVPNGGRIGPAATLPFSH